MTFLFPVVFNCQSQSCTKKKRVDWFYSFFLTKDDNRFVLCLGDQQWNTSSAPDSTLQYWTVAWTADPSSLLHLPDQTEGALALYVFTPSVGLCTEFINILCDRRLIGRKTVTVPELHTIKWNKSSVLLHLSFTHTHCRVTLSQGDTVQLLLLSEQLTTFPSFNSHYYTCEYLAAKWCVSVNVQVISKEKCDSVEKH